MVEHSLWELDELQAMNEVLGGVLQPEVEALTTKVKVQEEEIEAEAEECRRAADAGEVGEREELEEDAEEGWNWRMRWLRADRTGKEGRREGFGAEGESAIGQAGHVTDEEMTGSEEGEETAKAKGREGKVSAESVVAAVRHSPWELDRLRACNEVLGGLLQPEVDLTEEHAELFFGSEDDRVGGCGGDEGWEALRPGGRQPRVQKGEKGRSKRRRLIVSER